jgi:hypothetical protein
MRFQARCVRRKKEVVVPKPEKCSLPHCNMGALPRWQPFLRRLGVAPLCRLHVCEFFASSAAAFQHAAPEAFEEHAQEFIEDQEKLLQRRLPIPPRRPPR